MRIPGVRDALLATLGILGLAVLVWLALSATLGLRLTVFLTGSMAPAIPTGSLGVVQPVPASALVVGDVVQVARAHDGRPVTHRIVVIAPGDAAAERVLTLRGDANATHDRDAYRVSEAGLVLVAVPGLGAALLVARTPSGIAVTTAIVAAVVCWGLWPMSAPRSRRRGARRGDRERVRDAGVP